MSVKFTRRHRKTKIVATLGPASSDVEMIRKLFLAGVDVFRLNFSHAAAIDCAHYVKAIRQVEEEMGYPIGIFGDLQGPKIRIGRFEGGRTQLTAGQKFTFDRDTAEGNAQRVNLPHPEIFAVAKPGHLLLIDDGKLRMEITEASDDKIVASVTTDYVLKDRKGVSLPGAVLPISALTPKDRVDLEDALILGVDWIALSFVQRPEDITELKQLIKGRAHVIAKIEMPAAVESLSGIMELTDAAMVARGDLGVELPPEKVPGIQKRIVKMARSMGKPVIVATQMLESMIESPSPTRAEVSDVATAVFDGSDAVMLSAESAAGAYPIEAVTMMNRIAEEVEGDEIYRRIMDAQHELPQANTSGAISMAAREVAETVKAAAIVTFTTSGVTTLRASRERPAMPIVGLTSVQETARRMTLSFGVHPVHEPDIHEFAEMATRGTELSKKHGLSQEGDLVVITAGVPFAQAGSTNILHVAKVK